MSCIELELLCKGHAYFAYCDISHASLWRSMLSIRVCTELDRFLASVYVTFAIVHGYLIVILACMVLNTVLSAECYVQLSFKLS